MNLEAERTSHGKAGSMVLSMHGEISLHDQFAKAFKNCKTDRDRERAIEWAEKALAASRRPPQPAKGMAEPGSLAWKREIAAEASKAAENGKPKALREVARLYGVSHETVRKYRRDYGVEKAA